MVPGGDAKYLAPEVLNAYHTLLVLTRGEIAYAGQAAWELGNIMFELATGYEAWPEYPDAFSTDGKVAVLPSSLRPWLPESYPREINDAIIGLLHPNPERRSKLADVCETLQELKAASWGTGMYPEPTYTADESPTGEWCGGRSLDGQFAMVPYDSTLPIYCLRDNVASRLSMGRWWDFFGVMYEGKLWYKDSPTSEMKLKPESRVYLLADRYPPWPEGPVPETPWVWAECDMILTLRMLATLLEDHTSPVEFTLQGIDRALELVVVPEDEWDGA